jgi:hypothetical protein
MEGGMKGERLLGGKSGNQQAIKRQASSDRLFG